LIYLEAHIRNEKKFKSGEHGAEEGKRKRWSCKGFFWQKEKFEKD
jgi:hypothetical protein